MNKGVSDGALRAEWPRGAARPARRPEEQGKRGLEAQLESLDGT